MIGIYDYSVELDDPTPMNHSNIISIFSYLLYRTCLPEENFSSVVEKDFLYTVCKLYDKYTNKDNSFEVPQLIADWGEYKAVFTSRVDTDGLDLELYYCKNRMNQSEYDKTQISNGVDSGLNGEHKPCCGYSYCHDSDHPFGEHLYNSPFIPHYWYNKYFFDTMVHKLNKTKTNKEDSQKECEHHLMIELDGDVSNEDSTVTEKLPPTTEMNLIWSEQIPHNTLVKDIEIYQE